MNPRQRRGALLMILATLGAVVVFITVVGYVGSVEAQIGERTEVLVLRQPIPADEPINPSAVESVQVPRRWSPQTMITDTAELAGKVAAADLAQGSYLQQGMLVDAPVLEQGEREIAIMIDAETGVAGKVSPGMRVDIIATFQTQQGQTQQECAMRIIRNALVVLVGQLTTEASSNGQAQPQSQTDLQAVVPITFALTQAEMIELARAESFATKVRVALIGSQELEEAEPKPLPRDCTPTAR
jgi:pilus assembly protein CpaB